MMERIDDLPEPDLPMSSTFFFLLRASMVVLCNFRGLLQMLFLSYDQVDLSMSLPYVYRWKKLSFARIFPEHSCHTFCKDGHFADLELEVLLWSSTALMRVANLPASYRLEWTRSNTRLVWEADIIDLPQATT